MENENVEQSLQQEGSSVDIQSPEVNEIFYASPSKFIKYGLFVYGIILIILIIGCCLISYSDTIEGEISITSDNPPVWNVAQISERIKNIFVNNGDLVSKGDIIAELENSASVGDILLLDSLLSTTTLFNDVYVPEQLLVDTFSLGDVHPSYSDFLQSYVAYNNFTSLNLIDQEKTSLIKQQGGKRDYIKNLKKQLNLKEQYLEIATNIYNREKHLYDKGLIAYVDMEVAERNLLNEKEVVQQLRTTISMEEVEFSRLDESSTKLSFQYAVEYNQLVQDLISSYKGLCLAVKEWKQKYLLQAHVSGVVSFSSYWTCNQFVKSGEPIFVVVPNEASRFIGKMQIPLDGAGKIKSGQVVLIQSNAHPYMEYGYLYGTVSSLSLVPNNNAYIAEIVLPRNLVFSSGKSVDFTGELLGIAKIVTDKRTIISRIISPLFGLIEEHL